MLLIKSGTYLQGRNRHADVDNGLLEMGTNWEEANDLYTVDVCSVASVMFASL